MYISPFTEMIIDTDITTSSATENGKGKLARLNTEVAWTAKPSDPRPWIIVSLYISTTVFFLRIFIHEKYLIV